MKKWIIKGIVLSLFMGANAQALTRSQHDTAVGAVLGGVAGAVMGNDVTSTMAGAALGGVVGSQWNAHKEEKKHRAKREREHLHHHEGFRPARYEYDDFDGRYHRPHRPKHHKHKPHHHDDD
ncbi:glycine zipper 2TM domain-containing protein [Haemophilus sputorum]|uniref:Glycine zipper 2TM domain-containing protein n=1 Tax=Haemophilus sputorum TaxID=1078480 RepID=A0A369YJ09_9PAST|nr:glycine zipper 2TM domain-containing protein [Haemophilus sputorum]RDE72775.1 glycine zipper 2TM domain-containing protein [Haemophilus sputorum]